MAHPAAVPTLKLFINGEFVEPFSNQYFDVINPATEEVIARAAQADESDVDRAVLAARSAFESGCWSEISGKERAKYLRDICTEIRQRKPQLAIKETMDSGKPLKEAEWDMDDVAHCFEYFADQAEALDKRQYTPVPLPDANFKCELRYDAVGVVASIIPWNYPLLMMAWKVAPALAAGCCVVLKPSELTPLNALELCDIVRAVNLPAGVLNVVTGDGTAGSALVRHKEIDKIAFTGSVATGTNVAIAAAKDMKNVTLELGGKSPVIVFNDVDIPKAVEWVMFGVFWTNGQICSSTSRLLVQDSIAPAFLERLAAETRRIKIGNPNAKENAALTGMLGPLVSKNQLRKVKAFIDGAVQEGARLIAGGEYPPELKTGYFIQPTLLEVKPDMTIWREEVFGPVLSIVRFSTEEEAVRMANDSIFGLAGAVLSNDKERCARVARKLRCGIMWQNCSQPCFVEAPWGGVKKSGVGRELGQRGIDNYLETKQITTYVSDKQFGWFDIKAHL